MGKNAIYVWVGLAVLFVILWKANKDKEDQSSAIGGSPSSKMGGVVPCFCNGIFMGYSSAKNCKRGCRKAVKYGTL